MRPALPTALTICELDPSDTDAMLRLRNATFGHISRAHWDAMGCTAVVARRGRRFDGAIPLQYRDFVIRPRVHVPVVFENAVGVRDGLRGKGIGSAMLEATAGFMADRVDALYVYRSGERSQGYRFYRKTHHGDLYFVDTLSLARPRGAVVNVTVLPWTEAIGRERRLLRLFHACYGGHGGYWLRRPGYFRQIVASHVYGNDDCRLFLAGDREPTGYAIVNPHSAIWGGCCIYDLAAPAPAIRARLLDAIERHARRLGLPVTMPANAEHPLYRPLLKRGYRVTSHSPYVMARIIRPDRSFARLAARSTAARRIAIEVVTPHRSAVLNRPRRPSATVTLHLKESQLSRLLSCRLDLRSALATNLVRTSPLPAGVEGVLARLFQPAPWVTFGVDYA